MNVTDSYCTPARFVARMGGFTTDPCSNPRSHVQAPILYSLERNKDGLALPWFGRTWLNHPYSDPMPWVEKARLELTLGRCSELVCLPKHDHSTEWWNLLVSPIEGMICEQWQLHKRLQFDIPPEVLEELQRKHAAKCIAKGKPVTKMSTSNNFCTSVIHWRTEQQAPLAIDDIATRWILG